MNKHHPFQSMSALMHAGRNDDGQVTVLRIIRQLHWAEVSRNTSIEEARQVASMNDELYDT